MDYTTELSFKRLLESFILYLMEMNVSHMKAQEHFTSKVYTRYGGTTGKHTSEVP